MKIKRSLFEYHKGYPRWQNKPYLEIGSESAWRGRYFRVGRFRLAIEKTEILYKVESVGDRVQYQFNFYWDRRRNSFRGDRTIRYGRFQVVRDEED